MSRVSAIDRSTEKANVWVDAPAAQLDTEDRQYSSGEIEDVLAVLPAEIRLLLTD